MTSLRHSRSIQILALVAVLVLGASAAWAYWVAPSSGQGTGKVGSLAAPSGVGASAPVGGTSVSLTWTASAPEGGPSPSGYYAQRWKGSTPTVVGGACGTAGSPVTSTGCTDTAVADGTYTYTVVAVYHSWSAASAHSAPMTVTADTTPPVTSLATEPGSPNGSNGWFKQSSVAFTLSASDSGSGVAQTSYSVDGAEAKAYGSAVTISTPGDHTVSYWSKDKIGNEEAHHTAHIKIDASAPETSLALQPSSPNGSNGWYTSSPTFTLSSSDATSGVAASSYDIDGGTSKAYAGSGVAIPSGQHTITYWSTDNAGNVESSNMSAQVKVDTTAPTDSLSLGAAPVHAFQSATTVYFASALNGSFTLQDTVADSGSGAASARFPQLSASHWTHAAETVSSPAGGPFASSSYSWTAGAASPSAAERTITSTDLAGNTSTGTAPAFVADSTAPSGAALVVNGKAASSAGGTESFANTTSFTVGTRTDYTDSGSGLASSTLTVQSSTLSKGACGTPGSAGAYTSPTVIAAKTNPAIASGYCYLYTLTGTDNVGNTASISATVKVDTGAPSSSISLGTAKGAFLKESTLYYSGSGGSFTLLDTVSDANSGAASAVFPALSTFRWTHSKDTVTTPAEGPYASSAYSWSSNASAPSSSSERTVTASDNAGNATTTTLTFVSDTTAPSGGALTVNGTAASTTAGASTSTSSTGNFSISSRTDYKETQSSTQSGLESSVLTIQSETLSNGACGTAAGAYATPAVISGTTNPVIVTGYCYVYTLSGTDNVENEAAVSTTVKVDTTAPGAPLVALSSATGNTFVSGTTVYINPQTGKSGSFVAAGSAADTESGIASIKLPSLTGFTSGGGTLSSPFETTYKWSGTPGATGTQSATSTNGTGLTETNASAFTVVADTTAPTGGSVSAPGRVSGSAAVTFAAGTDSASGISTSLDEILRAEASYTASSDSCGTFGTFGTKLTPAGSPYSDTSINNTHCYEYKYVASDNVGNATTYGPTSAVKPGPKGLSLTAENGGVTKKKVDAKDIIKFTFTESIEPASITSAWTAASQPEQNVAVTFKDNGSGNGTNKPDNFSVTTAGVHIGTVEMSGGSWVPTISGSYSFNATMKFGTESGKSVVTITLVSLQSGGTATPGEQSKDIFTWTPDKAITDTAGVAIDTSAVATPEAEHF
jgi:hypothetical protein